MLRHYLDEIDIYSLKQSLKNKKQKTVYFFIGSGCNGKTTVANHLQKFQEIYVCDDYEWDELLVDKNTSKTIQAHDKIIVVCNTDIEEKLISWANNNGYGFEKYRFTRYFGKLE